MTCEPRQTAKPIAGWLVLPALGLLLSPIQSVKQIWSSWQLLNSPQLNLARELVPNCSRAVACELGMDALILCLLLYVAVLFFQKKRAAPRAFIVLMLAHLGYTLLDEFVLGAMINLKPDVGAILKSLILCSIWISYFFVSRRVEETFIVE